MSATDGGDGQPLHTEAERLHLEAFRKWHADKTMANAVLCALAEYKARNASVDWDYMHALGAAASRLAIPHTKPLGSLTPQAAIARALGEHQATGHSDPDYITGLTHASECLHDMFTLLRYLRAQLPTREPELQRLITAQLIKGCDA